MTLPSAQLTPSSATPENPLHILEVTSPIPKSTLTATTASPHKSLIPLHWFFTNSSFIHNISPRPILSLAGPCLVGSCVPTAAAILGFGHPPITLTHHHPLVCGLSTKLGKPLASITSSFLGTSNWSSAGVQGWRREWGVSGRGGLWWTGSPPCFRRHIGAEASPPPPPTGRHPLTLPPLVPSYQPNPPTATLHALLFTHIS